MHAELGGEGDFASRLRRARRRDMWVVLTQFVVTVGVILFVWWSVHDGRRELVEAERSACERGRERDVTTGLSWRAQAIADQAIADDPLQPVGTRKARGVAAARHRVTATILEEGSRLSCVEAFPLPTVP